MLPANALPEDLPTQGLCCWLWQVRDCLWVAETKENRLLSLTVLTQEANRHACITAAVKHQLTEVCLQWRKPQNVTFDS
jgi:hypothetical protein